jgi:hypothetical protein
VEAALGLLLYLLGSMLAAYAMVAPSNQARADACPSAQLKELELM